VNSAGLPEHLLESELFGHERGAFTGAHREREGKFELANGGTLFFDEIGDMPLKQQAALLSVISNREVTRLGGTKPIHTDFRLIVATNTDLEKAVKEGRFREDLFYRVKVIPITIPPLRERVDDIPPLLRFFFERFKTKYHREVRGFADATLKLLSTYSWPGNVRELQNVVERLVAVSDKEWITEEDLPLEYHFARLDSKQAKRSSGNCRQPNRRSTLRHAPFMSASSSRPRNFATANSPQRPPRLNRQQPSARRARPRSSDSLRAIRSCASACSPS
jgi:transcriptional regulator with PAS, ATPase and Fis domain